MDRLAGGARDRRDAAREARRPHRPRARRQQGPQARAARRRTPSPQGADCLVTGGGPQSNHARITAAAARRIGLDCHLALAGDEPGRRDGNLLLDELLGAHAALRSAPTTTTASRRRSPRSPTELRAEGRTALRDPGRRARRRSASRRTSLAVDELRTQLDRDPDWMRRRRRLGRHPCGPARRPRRRLAHARARRRRRHATRPRRRGPGAGRRGGRAPRCAGPPNRDGARRPRPRRRRATASCRRTASRRSALTRAHRGAACSIRCTRARRWPR